MAEKKKKKGIGGKAATSAVAAVTAAGVMVGGAFSSPQEILEDSPEVIVQSVALDTQTAADADGGGTDTEEEEITGEEEEKRGARASVRKLVRSAPLGVRALVVLPLWALGTFAIILANGMWSAVLSPTVSVILSWLGMALLAVLLYTLAVKTVFPDMLLKKILNKRSLLTILSLCLLFGAADALLPVFWEDYEKLSRILKAVGSLFCTGVPAAFFLRRQTRKAPQETIEAEPVEDPAPAPTMAEREASARALVTELADSVCRKA